MRNCLLMFEIQIGIITYIIIIIVIIIRKT